MDGSTDRFAARASNSFSIRGRRGYHTIRALQEGGKPPPCVAIARAMRIEICTASPSCITKRPGKPSELAAPQNKNLRYACDAVPDIRHCLAHDLRGCVRSLLAGFDCGAHLTSNFAAIAWERCQASQGADSPAITLTEFGQTGDQHSDGSGTDSRRRAENGLLSLQFMQRCKIL
ncbi:hypothetical protein J2T09_000250 [Neorhizobium huautlense]|uniref:Uncharacterized protein n=1 Tax=Neorhizobium huautlense TaxID=67774 RepID=A0ABT9PP89_9HYPH|nr:hypothetical protein [Neorhizobium huautlense]